MIELLSSFSWTQLLQPQWYIENGALWLLLFVVFAETGLFAGFFLPGDTLLFVAGIYAHKIGEGPAAEPGLAYQFLKHFNLGHLQSEWVDLIILWLLISICGVLGNMIGYWTGRKVGPSMYHWKENFSSNGATWNRRMTFMKNTAAALLLLPAFFLSSELLRLLWRASLG